MRRRKIPDQALDRTQPGLPLKKGRAATIPHDYKRHGMTTLFAALDFKSGLVIGERPLASLRAQRLTPWVNSRESEFRRSDGERVWQGRSEA